MNIFPVMACRVSPAKNKGQFSAVYQIRSRDGQGIAGPQIRGFPGRARELTADSDAQATAANANAANSDTEGYGRRRRTGRRPARRGARSLGSRAGREL